MISANIAAVLYLVSGVLFILALRGLSSPASARRGNTFGIVGMAIAVVTTLLIAAPSDMLSWALIIGGIGLGGVIGAVMARRIAMTDMPQLVAAFHSLVGLAAVFVAAAALYAPDAFGIATDGHIHAQALVEMSLGVAIGAFTFHRFRDRVCEAKWEHVRQADYLANASPHSHRDWRGVGVPRVAVHGYW